MFELTINGEIYEFHFGMGFLRELDKSISVPIDSIHGARQNVGTKLTIAKVLDGDLDALSGVLLLANKGKKPRLTQTEMDAHIENENTDVDKLFEDVIGFFEKANVTKKVTANLKVIMMAEQNQK